MMDINEDSPKDTTTHTVTRIISEDQQMANEIHRPITRKFKKCKVYSSYRDNIWGADLEDMQTISKYN